MENVMTQESGPEGAAPDFESMSVDELQKVVDSEGAAPETPAPAKTDEPAERSTEEVKPEAPKEPEFDPRSEIENLRRELGRFRKMQSEFDRLPDTVAKRVEAELQRRIQDQQRQQLEQLSPEDQVAYQQQLKQQEQLEKLVVAKAEALIQGKYGKYAELLQQMEEQQKDGQYLQTVAQIAGDEYPQLQPSINEVWKTVAKDMDSTDPNVKEAALAKFDQLTAQPALVVLEAQRLHNKQVTNQAATFAQNRAEKAKAAAQTPAGGAAPATGQKALRDMSQKELDALPTEELEKRLAAEERNAGR